MSTELPTKEDPDQLERLEIEYDYYRSLPAYQFRDLVEETLPRLWKFDPLVVKKELQGKLIRYHSHWQADNGVVRRLEAEAQEQIRGHWAEQGIWDILWDKRSKRLEEYRITGGWKDFYENIEDDAKGLKKRQLQGFPLRSIKRQRLTRTKKEKIPIVREHESRPYHLFMYQVARESEWLKRQHLAPADAISSAAYRNVKDCWIKRRIWLRSWNPAPGMTWGHEMPLRDFVLESRPSIPQDSLDARVQRWTQEGVGTREPGTWESSARKWKMAWSAAVSTDSNKNSETILSDMLPALLRLPKPPPPPGLFGRVEVTCMSAKPKRPMPPSWCDDAITQLTSKGEGQGLRQINFDEFEFPCGLNYTLRNTALANAFYLDCRFRKAILKRTRQDYISSAENEEAYEKEHQRLKNTLDQPDPGFTLSPEIEDSIARRYEAYTKLRRNYELELAEYRKQLKKIDFSNFDLPPDVKVERRHWADRRLKDAVMRRTTVTDRCYEARHKKSRSEFPMSLEEDYHISAEEEDELQRRLEDWRRHEDRIKESAGL
ncbi:hypothetical protein JX266_010766 [Neoarthrinium moseri]|nr:hypothetical protein JX266_010766 [Neoarthrinium moseri]